MATAHKNPPAPEPPKVGETRILGRQPDEDEPKTTTAKATKAAASSTPET